MKDMKLSNIQKESERLRIKKEINDCEDRKAQVLLQMGIKTFDKIRKNELIDSDYDELCEEIKHIDIDIYTNYMKLRSLEKENKKTKCECGYVAFKNEKFCPQCGNNLVQEEEEIFMVCGNCNEKTEIDSNYCACCGSKISRENSHENNEVYIEEYDFENNIIEDEVIIDCVSEKHNENQVIEDGENILKDVDNINENSYEVQSNTEEFTIVENNNEFENEEKYIEKEGREFLKYREQVEEKNNRIEE
ncbi:zinc ribbon domain-containing protein [Terrisporobacter sp.]|uniref:zinc ribbon domain-containing protein n=1 Tax=Terrisporobacter sp. TaxID=1965305 RepID=UPI002632C3E9|nr:zinc ribbon domain-containing protein [Terrisporobacter sp.]